jgi:uncharacterized protein HemX
MTEERITETETPSGNTHTTHTVVHDDGARRGGSGWLIALVLVLVAVAGIYFISQQSDSEIARDNAVAEAADSVSEAANQVGDAAQEAGAAATDAVNGE